VAAQGNEAPVELVRREVTAVLQILDDKKLDAASRRSVVSDRIARYFDFDDMSQSILAVNWKSATDAQKERFKVLLRRTLERKYVSAIEKRTTEVVKVGGERIRGDRATVIVTIERDQASDIPLLFKLKRSDAGWRAYDANVEGLSLVQHYRERFATIAKNKGIEGVLSQMEASLAA
jgi:phospholipid transport system substrate-binding protein